MKILIIKLINTFINIIFNIYIFIILLFLFIYII